ncbi:DUF3574 domain-containing protein [Phreatobacter cathodiphilus]|uniref:DUF3574 domain-containing protein n=1 Tax=Phreatobacter cathodiphilus TaxID=1868589 RepID=UPI001FE426F6|nr:DUF3574 domain-containing protein [Phreatobacter cathodiphilus]
MAAACAALALSACVTAAPPSCPPGGRERLVAELLFGRKIGDVVGVGEHAFARFVDREITPRFPAGLTITDSRGQYRHADGRIVREPGKVVTIVLDDEARDLPRLADIAAAYRRQFRQESVGVMTRRACVAF